jgi:hypothetical protein
MPRFSYGGSEVLRPEQLRRLPLALYRSQNYPAQPGFMGEQMQQYLSGAEPNVLVPRSMMYTRWTRARDVFGANVVGLLAALKESRDVQSRMQSYALGNAPVMDYYQAADAVTGSQLPSLEGLAQQDFNRVPLARNAMPIGKFLSADELQAAVKQQYPLP